MIEVTHVRVFPFEPGYPEKSLRAYAEITLNGQLVLKGIKVFENSKGGVFIGYPSRPGRDDTWQDMVVPLDEGLKKTIRDAVVTAYKSERDFS
ncbi:MAG: SpoVG family protein [Nitrospina sp.]|nr:SpoVG family protein [Nitrospina sp.]